MSNELPQTGENAEQVLDELRAKRVHDVRWQHGRTFGLVFDGGADVHEVAAAAAEMFLHDNALNPKAFPSLAQIQADVVAMTGALLHAPTDAGGFFTSGGTDSILCAVVGARERARVERGVTAPEIVLPVSAHAAFHKAAHYFDLTTRVVPVRDDWTADAAAAADVVNERTVLVVGSAPQYPQGVVDPIPELAALAATVGASMHVDACMGGFVLPFAERLGVPVPPWDFRVEGVTSMSADVHKLGYAPKGASVVLYRDRALRRHQTFVFDGWLGGAYGSPGLQGTRSGAPMAAAWAVMRRLGVEGYLRLTRATLDAARQVADGVRAIDGLTILGEPVAHCLAISADPSRPALDVFAVSDVLHERGWHLDRQAPPDSLHLTVSAGNAPVVEDFLRDLAEAAQTARTASDRSTTYASIE